MDEQVNSTPSLADYYGLIKAEHEANNAWSAEQAQKAMDYQTQMSNTAHQREVEDLKAAGLNPILSAGGQGATTGTGQTAQRSDSNIDALYGLAKMAIENSMVQASAMANTAKYSSGNAGSSLAKNTSYTKTKNVSEETPGPEHYENPNVIEMSGITDKELNQFMTSMGHILSGKVTGTDVMNVLRMTGKVVSTRKQYAEEVANAPNSYFEAVLDAGLNKGIDKIESGNYGNSGKTNSASKAGITSSLLKNVKSYVTSAKKALK